MSPEATTRLDKLLQRVIVFRNTTGTKADKKIAARRVKSGRTFLFGLGSIEVSLLFQLLFAADLLAPPTKLGLCLITTNSTRERMESQLISRS